eukprot:m.210187 g.210187  ORF g.210187 m.210187 type:complete len:52 (+) comp18556_c0_seq3:582-737(+)
MQLMQLQQQRSGASTLLVLTFGALRRHNQNVHRTCLQQEPQGHPHRQVPQA